MILKNVCGHSFVSNFLHNEALIFDCGANHGDFSAWFSKNHNAVIHAFEPDPRLFPKLPKLRQATFYPMAVSGTGKPLTLMLGDTRCSTAFFSEKPGQSSVRVDSVRLEQFCKDMDIVHIDLIKLDVEGAEIEILNGLSMELLSNVGQITVEFHDFLQKEEMPRIRKVIDKLKAQGFFYICFSHSDYSDVLFINKRICNLTWMAVLKIYGAKYYRGLQRIIGRLQAKGDKGYQEC